MLVWICFFLLLFRTTLSTNRLFFGALEDGRPAGSENPVPKIPLAARQLVSDVQLRRGIEKYSGVARYRTGEWHVSTPTMAKGEFNRMLIRLKDDDQRPLTALMAACNESGEFSTSMAVI